VLFPRTDVDLAGHSVEYESIVRIRQVDDIVFRLDISSQAFSFSWT